MGRAVGFMDDLFFQMKIAETAKHVGVDFKVASTGEALMGMLDASTKLVIIDLNAKNQPLATLERLRTAQKDLRVVAFLSHITSKKTSIRLRHQSSPSTLCGSAL